MTCFYEHPQGSKELVYEVEVNVPPIGMVWDHLEGKWVQTEIYDRTGCMDAPEQYWERPLPFDYNRKRKFEKDKQASNAYYIDPDLEAFREQEWFRRLNGFWFYNNGVPTYITGTHYFYLTWWKIDVGYPQYRDISRQKFYLWSYVEGDPNATGLIEATRRRAGKTAEGSCIHFEYPSRSILTDTSCMIQSKTREDASKVFNKLVNSFRQLPDFFKPIYDTSSGTRPKSKLILQGKSRGSKEDSINDDTELGTTIEYASYEILAPDGTKQIRYLRDEAGKTELADVSDGYDVLKPCLMVGTRSIVGKCLFTSTVEEGGSLPFLNLWNDSNFLEKDPDTNRTRTGMYRIFIPSYKNDFDFIDKYGICDEEASKEAQMKERAALQAFPKKLASYIRKNPFTADEAFRSFNNESLFDSIKINQQLESLSFMKEEDYMVRGNLRWTDGIGSPVKFVENFNGLWRINKKFIDAINNGAEITNNFTKVGDKYVPNSKNTSVVGADTFDHSKKNISDQNQMSKAAFYTYWRHDPLNEDLSDTFACEYIHRQDDADLMAEDLCLQTLFFGSVAIIENNKPAAISWFTRNGFKDFLVRIDGRDGISGTMKNKQSMVETIETYVNESCDKIVFPKLLHDFNLFSLEDSTKFDATMGAGYALLVATRIGKAFQKKPEHRVRGIESHASSIYRKYL